MKQTINKIKDGLLFGIGFLLILGITHAWTGLNSMLAEEGDTLTTEKYNKLVSGIASTKGYITMGNSTVYGGENISSVELQATGKMKINFIVPYLDTYYKFNATTVTGDYSTVVYNVDIFEKNTNYIIVLAQKSNGTNANMNFDFTIVE